LVQGDLAVYKHLVPKGTKTFKAFPHIRRRSRKRAFTLEINSPETIERILKECRTIAIVGLSSKPTRSSYGVAGYMQRAGYRIIPVNPNEVEVFSEKAYRSLADVPEKIDLVDVFRRSEEAGAAVDEAIAIGAKAVWLQEGVIDNEAAQRALDAGLLVVMDRCWLKEHARRKK
jgi:predicted CoA-binding protein